MRNLNAAPVIHARLKNNDFPSGLLVAPEDFTQEDIRFCRKKITASTGYFEMAGEDGRRVFFCNQRYAVIGASITIKRLYETCRKEPRYVYVDGRRINYGFIGLAIPKSELLSQGFMGFPYQTLLKYYEFYMDQLWDITTDFTTAKRAPYERVCFDERAVNIGSLPGFEGDRVAVIDENEIPADVLVSCLMNQTRRMREFSFCSDAPNVTYVQKGGYNAVSALHPESIRAGLEKCVSEHSGDNRPAGGQSKTGKGSRSGTYDESDWGNDRKKEKLLLLLAAGIGIVVLIIIFSKVLF